MARLELRTVDEQDSYRIQTQPTELACIDYKISKINWLQILIFFLNLIYCSAQSMATQAHPLHILFFPLMSPSHILSILDMAKLFAARGVKATIIATPANAHTVQLFINRTNGDDQFHPIQLLQIPFPSTAHGLPEGCESLSSLPSEDMKVNFLEATFDLRQPFRRVLGDLRPDCVVTNTFLPWTYEVAAELGIPRLVFHGMSLFAICARTAVDERRPHENVPEEAESFVVPGLPHRIEMHRSNMPKLTVSTIPPVYLKMFSQLKEFEPKSYGLVANTFYELEPDYVDHYRKTFGRKIWNLGPVSLCNRDTVDKSERGNESSTDGDAYLKWLDGKSPGSVVYVCFGSISEFSSEQLREISLGLEASNHSFIWVVRKGGNEWIPEGFEKRVEGRGVVIKGWAPQILILNHESVGGFVTHCGWNSSLEGISAGLPIVTWPLFAEQFYNERLIVDVLKIGVPIGSKVFRMKAEDEELIAAATIEEAVSRLMDAGEEATERRRMAKAIKEMAKKAMEKDGSSYGDMSLLIQELMDRRVTETK